jgi:hypothetical protein
MYPWREIFQTETPPFSPSRCKFRLKTLMPEALLVVKLRILDRLFETNYQLWPCNQKEQLSTLSLLLIIINIAI